jgi:transposase
MEKPVITIGIDVSKSHLDICILSHDSSNAKEASAATAAAAAHNHHRIANRAETIEEFFQDTAGLSTPDGSAVIVCLENTGRYSNAFLSAYLSGALPEGSRVYVVDARLILKSSASLQRGKTDKIDAGRIAEFIARHHPELEPWQPKSAPVEQLHLLQTERRRLVKQKRQTQTAGLELTLMTLSPARSLSQKINRQMLETISCHIREIDRLILKIINDDDNLRQTSTLLRSITGVGPVLASALIIKTNAFTTINTPRQLACMAGVAPFEHQSGSSIKRKPRLSHMADKDLKTLLHLAAMSAIQRKGDLQDFYKRKVSEGKNKMSTLNAIRNKIIHRVCSVIKHKKIYQPYLTLS